MDHYVSEIVNPALENFDRISSRLHVNSTLSYNQGIGNGTLPEGVEFTNSCRDMLGAFLEAHRTMSELQQSLVATVTRFRDNLFESSALYSANEAASTRSFNSVSARLDPEGGLR